MIVADTIAGCREQRSKLGRLALVPTMGALHQGHLSLIELARERAPHVAVSLFVNPTQFGPREDFNRYPRPIEQDLEMCRSAGVDLVFNPAAEEMYPPNQADVVVDLPGLTAILEGKHRPGHFKGVCQIVAKLLNIIQPQVACFGQKDYQQLRVLAAMVESLNWPIDIVAGQTVREPDGLAMSSRNRYLSDDERRRALSISRALFSAEQDVKNGIRQANRLVASMQRMLLEQHLNIDYVAAMDAATLRNVDMIEAPTVLLIAARAGNTRLIDNIIVHP
jgi:pantoate--beta-alanine ligase